ncbi:MAG: 30S ribosomal protein S6 [Bacteroidia bacterium]
MNKSKQYETVFILTPVLSEEQTKEAVEFYRKTLKDQGAKITNEEHWGLKKLAYPIQKKSTGFYHVIQFEGPATCVKELDITYYRDERILRYLTVALDKHALAYLEKRKTRLGKGKESDHKKGKVETTLN